MIPALCQPTRRTEDLTVQHVGAETLLYDERTQTAFCLHRITAAVWQLSDGTRTPEAQAADATRALGTPVSVAMVTLALADLRRDGLLATEPIPEPTRAEPATTRRDLLAHLGLGTAMLLPAIAMIAAPRAAEAYNGTVSNGIHSPAGQRFEQYQQDQAADDDDPE